MRKGMIYTSFALIASALLVSMAFLPFNTPESAEPSKSFRIGQSSFFLDSVLDDMDRSLSLATRRMLTSSTNYVITENQELVNPKENLSSALVNGTISGQELENMENISMSAWTEKVSEIGERSGYNLNATLEDYSFNSSNFIIESSYTVSARLEDPITQAAFNRSNTANTTVEVQDLEDPMLTLRSKARYVSKYSRCGFDRPVEKIGTGDTSKGLERGQGVYYPTDPAAVSDKNEKILVVEDVDAHSTSEVNNFAAAVSENPNSSSGYSTVYAFDTGNLPAQTENQTLIVDEGDVWRSDLEYMFTKRCYIKDTIGPDPVDRLSNRLVNDDGDGILTLIDVSALPSELRKEDSAVGYAYFNESAEYGGDQQIKEVSDDFNWFRLDQDHIDQWGANELVK